MSVFKHLLFGSISCVILISTIFSAQAFTQSSFSVSMNPAGNGDTGGHESLSGGPFVDTGYTFNGKPIYGSESVYSYTFWFWSASTYGGPSGAYVASGSLTDALEGTPGPTPGDAAWLGSSTDPSVAVENPTTTSGLVWENYFGQVVESGSFEASPGDGPKTYHTVSYTNPTGIGSCVNNGEVLEQDYQESCSFTITAGDLSERFSFDYSYSHSEFEIADTINAQLGIFGTQVNLIAPSTIEVTLAFPLKNIHENAVLSIGGSEIPFIDTPEPESGHYRATIVGSGMNCQNDSGSFVAETAGCSFAIKNTTTGESETFTYAAGEIKAQHAVSTDIDVRYGIFNSYVVLEAPSTVHVYIPQPLAGEFGYELEFVSEGEAVEFEFLPGFTVRKRPPVTPIPQKPEMPQEIKDKIERIQASIEKIDANITKKQAQIDAVPAKIQAQQDKIEVLNNRVASFQGKIDGTSNQKRKARWENRIVRFEASIEKKETSISRLEARSVKLEAQIGKLEVQKQKKEDRITTLSEDY